MLDEAGRAVSEPSLRSNGLFVVHLRSDSNVERQILRGRIEHILSGNSERFESLSALFAFMARHAPTSPGDTPSQDSPERAVTTQLCAGTRKPPTTGLYGKDDQ